MKREIKFRFFSYEVNLMLEAGSIDFKKGLIYIYFSNGFSRGFAIEESELMQFTGLYDMQGVELFEGDIVRVYFDNGTTFFHFVKDYFSVFTLGLYCVDFDILGNAYENPELLKEIN